MSWPRYLATAVIVGVLVLVIVWQPTPSQSVAIGWALIVVGTLALITFFFTRPGHRIESLWQGVLSNVAVIVVGASALWPGNHLFDVGLVMYVAAELPRLIQRYRRDSTV